MPANYKNFIDLIIKTKVARFGKFVLKSGKVSDVFFDFGQIYYGSDLLQLGKYYAEFIFNNSLYDVDVLFGPAYKGINIAIATSIALFHEYGISIPFVYNRKTPKKHAEGGNFVGYPLSLAKSVLIVDDVFTDGGTKYEIINLLSQFKQLKIKGIVVGIDRQEVDENGELYSKIFMKNTGIKLYSITTKEEVLSYDKQRWYMGCYEGYY